MQSKGQDMWKDTVYGSFETISQKFPERSGLICLGEHYSYARVREMVLRLAAALRELGTREGDRVLLYVHNLPQSVIAYLALHRLNAVPVPVAPVYTAYDLRYFANDLDARTIICMDSNLSYVDEVLPETPLNQVVVTNMADLVPWWKRGIANAFDRVPRGKAPMGEGFFSFKRLIRAGRPHTLPPFTPGDHEATALILYTGGTTGEPKGVPLSMGLVVSRIREWRKLSQPIVGPGHMVTALTAPFYHIIGQMDALTPLLTDGGALVVFPRVHLDALMDHIARYQVTNMFAVPAMYRMILEHDRLDQYDLSSLRYCGCGGDVLPLEVARRWEERFGIPLYQGYGTTETCGTVTATYVKDGRPPDGSIGKVVPGNAVRLVDPETLEPVPSAEGGDLLCAAKYGMKAYWNKPRESAQAFVEMEGKVWYRTRDIVRMDDQGWCFFMDRTADIIKHKGYRVAAAEVEKVLQEHPAVTASCVVGIPDEKSGEWIKAFVVVKEDVKGVNTYLLKKWCADRLAPYKIPQYIEFRDMLPKSKVGKMLRREMRSEELKKRST
mgnify:FL=1